VSPLRLRTCMRASVMLSPRELGPSFTRAGRSSDSRARHASTSVRATYWPSLPRLFVFWAQCLMTAVVPVYRCGAVPESHRVPCCHHDPGKAAEPAARDTIYRPARKTKYHMSCRRVVSSRLARGAGAVPAALGAGRRCAVTQRSFVAHEAPPEGVRGPRSSLATRALGRHNHLDPRREPVVESRDVVLAGDQHATVTVGT
jgi:hypothetical protein